MATEPINTTGIQDAYAKRQQESEGRINTMFDKQLASQNQQLATSRDQSIAAQEEARAKLAPQYQTANNDLHVQYERNKRNLNAQALANGLNTGTGSQQRLALNQGYMKGYAGLKAQEAEENAGIDRQIANIQTSYQNQVAQALADNDYKRAAALMDNYNNLDTWQQQQAQTLASYGNFDLYAQLYGQSTADSMKSMWTAQNPDLAYRTGQISAAQYKAMTGSYPAGYSAPRSGGGGYYGGGGGNPRTPPADGGGDGDTPTRIGAENALNAKDVDAAVYSLKQQMHRGQITAAEANTIAASYGIKNANIGSGTKSSKASTVTSKAGKIT